MDIATIRNDVDQEKQNQKPNVPKDVSAVLETVIHHIGEIGLYQRLLFLGMLPFGVSWAFVYLGQMFLTATPQEHWCRVPELEGLSVELRRSLSIPGAVDGDYDHCAMFDANWTQVLETLQPPGPGTPIIPCQNGWEFLFEDIPYSTIVNEREWVCDNANLVPWSQAINFLGSIIGGILCGTLADKYGRVPVLVLANLLGCLGGITTMYTSGFWDFSACRFIVGMACDSCFLMMYILVLEYVGTRHRTWVANLSIAVYFGGGCILLPWLALWISDWRFFALATSLPMLLVLVAPFVVPESARWLVSNGRVDRAVAILKRFEKINGTKVPAEVMKEYIHVAKSSQEKEESVLVLFKTPSLRLIIIFLMISFMAVALSFDGLVRLSENLGLDFFITFTVTSATEVPSIAILVLLLDRFGRRWLVCAPMVVAGILSFAAAFVLRGIAAVSLAVTARFLINMSYAAVIQWTPELLPTAARASGASFVHISGFAAIMLSPFIVYSLFIDKAWEGLSLILVAVVAIIGGGVALLLPETMGKRMPQTMEDWVVLAQTRRLFGRNKESSPSAPDEQQSR
ncbi:solute carrier family 22 member 3-like [Epargyreus clarus]|uniref:solute carrier family 22 member 3-like n=1 Tax=Epargyreus clarus TaxID=520877 RepID=UPI003C2DC094